LIAPFFLKPTISFFAIKRIISHNQIPFGKYSIGATNENGGKCKLGYFAFVGFLLILIDFIPLAVGLGQSKGNFQSKFIKMAAPTWLIMLIFGIILIIIP